MEIPSLSDVTSHYNGVGFSNANEFQDRELYADMILCLVARRV